MSQQGSRAEGADLVEVLSAPAGIVVVGASSRPGAVAARPLEYLNRLGYAGAVHVVHPREPEVLGRPAVASIEDLPAGIDVAMLCTPAAAVPDAVRALDARGVRAAVSIAGGFEDHRTPLRAELRDTLAGSDIRLIGPNCTGLITPASGTFLTMSSLLQRHDVPRGGVALVTQSGGMGNGLVMSLLRRGAGISHLITTGDELDTGCLEIVAGLLAREEVRAVGMFIEGITDPAWLPGVAELIGDTGSPVVFVKAARTAAGRLAAGGHTGRVVGPADIASALLADAGLREARDLEQLGDALVCADLIGRPASGRVGVVCVSGASAVVAADKVATARRLSLSVPSPEVSAAVRPELDERLTFANPLDVGFNETLPIAGAIQAMRGADGFDTVLAVVTSLAHDPDVLAAELTKPAEGLCPLVVTFLSAEDAMPSVHLQRLNEARIAVLPTPERAVAALDLLAPGPPEDPSVTDEHDPTPALIGIEAVADLVSGADLRLAPWEIVTTVDEADRAATGFGYPVVLKVAGRTLMHRSEAGGVAVGVTGERLPEMFADLHRTATEHGDAVMVQRQADGGFELMLSVIDSPEFGPVAILRPGGVLAELMKEQVILAASWTHRHRLDVLVGSTLGVVLDGYRGGRRYDLGAVVELADAATRVLTANGLAWLELNPVIVGETGAVVVDAIAAAGRTPQLKGQS